MHAKGLNTENDANYGFVTRKTLRIALPSIEASPFGRALYHRFMLFMQCRAVSINNFFR